MLFLKTSHKKFSRFLMYFLSNYLIGLNHFLLHFHLCIYCIILCLPRMILRVLEKFSVSCDHISHKPDHESQETYNNQSTRQNKRLDMSS